MKHFSQYKEITLTKNSIICFDIEVSSYWLVNNKVIGYDMKIDDETYNTSMKGALPYIWQCGIEGDVYYGRWLEEFKTFLETILKNQTVEKIFCIVHNLAYEFQFLRNIFDFKKVFARTERKPIKASVYIGKKEVEFRCSYILTRLSLETWGKSLGIDKLTGALDYHALRTPLTKLSEKEMSYCEHDILIMQKGMKNFLEKYGSIEKIPLTQTGEVRRVVKDLFKKNNRWHKICTNLLPKNVDEYKIYKAVFAGGDTHGNPRHIGNIVDNVQSHDETSGYPSFMVRKKYPSTPFRLIKVKNINQLIMDTDKYCYIIGIKMKNIRAKSTLHYISRHRMLAVENGFYENGRVINADTIYAYLTELDFEIISHTYDFEYEIVSLRRSMKDYLHKDLITFILQLFANKTELKKDNQTEEEYNLYMQSKQFINSLYGMCVTDIVPLEVEFNGEWKKQVVDENRIEECIEELHKKSYKNFNAYTTGIWVTAWGRYELWNAILQIPEKDVVYFDTDSVKNLNDYSQVFEKLNEIVSHETICALRYHGIDENEFIKYTPQGKKCVLGAWEKEKSYDKFITLGAKKYAYLQDSEIHCTVSGVPKKASVCLNRLEDFKDGFVFDRDICEKNLTTYLDGDNLQCVVNKGQYDECLNDFAYGINIRNCGYTLGITQEFKIALNRLKERNWGRYE